MKNAIQTLEKIIASEKVLFSKSERELGESEKKDWLAEIEAINQTLELVKEYQERGNILEEISSLNRSK